MNRLNTPRLWHALAPAILLASFCLPTVPENPVAPADEEEGYELDLRDVVKHAKIKLRQAVQNALEAQPGIAVEANLEGEVEEGKTEIFFEVMIVGPRDTLYEVKLDPKSGKVIEKSRETDPEELEELVAFKNVLRHTELTLDQLLGSAEGIVKGKAVAAMLELDDEGPECEVLFANGRYLIEVDLEARAGHLIDIELLGIGGDDDEDEEGQEQEDDDEDDDEGEDDDEDEDEDDDDDEEDDD